VIEDIHWADKSSLEFLEILTARMASSRLLLVLTSRPLDDAAGTHLAHVPNVEVRRLNGETIAALVEQMDPGHLIDAATRDAVVIRAEGNPLFAEQLVLLAFRAQSEQRSGDVLTLPSSLNDSLLAHLDRLGALRPVAQAAAVIGREFDRRILAEILGIASAELSTSLAGLVTSGTLNPIAGEAQEVYTFRHSLIRDAAYHSLLKGRRAAIHMRAATVLVSNYPFTVESQPELVAQHYQEAGQLTEAIHWWTKAGELASRQSTTADSIRLLERAWALCARLKNDAAAAVRKAEVLNLLGVQYIAAHGYASSTVDRAFTDAVALLENHEQARPASLLFALWGLHVHSVVRADVPRALVIGARILSLAAESNDDGMILQGHRLQGLASLLTGAHSDAAHHYTQVLQRYDQVDCEDHRFRYGGDPKVLALAQLAWSEWICGNIKQSEEHAIQAVDLARAMEHSHSLVYAVGVNALRLLTARDFDGAAAMMAEARGLADRFGFSYWAAWCGVLEAALELPKNPERACQRLTIATERYQRTGARQLIPFARSIEAECWLNMGRPREARAVADAALSLVEETGVRIYQAELLRMRACASYQLTGSTGGEDLAAAIAIARRQGAWSFVLRSLAVGAESG
jgi:predicted ATPase